MPVVGISFVNYLPGYVFYEPLKHCHLARVLGGQHFGVPLNAENELAVGHIDGFHEAVIRDSGYAQTLSQGADGLVMEGVDHHGCGSEDVGGKGAIKAGDLVRLGGVGLTVRLVGGALRVNVLVERAAAGYERE